MTALVAFESVARLKSVTAAAAELFRTQSAISRQISTLEAQLGVPLFNRLKQQLLLTEAGTRYYADVCRILDDLQECTRLLSPQRKQPRSLCLRVGSSFCDRWLIKRLSNFSEVHPDIDVSVSISRSIKDLPLDRVDIFIGMCVETGLDLKHERLIDERLIVVGVPGKFEGVDATSPMLHHSLRKGDWRRYMTQRGLVFDAPPGGLSFDKFNAVIQAALAGMGIALVPDFMVQDELDGGLLEQLDPVPLLTGHGYNLSFMAGRARTRAAEEFVAWIQREARPFNPEVREAA